MIEAFRVTLPSSTPSNSTRISFTLSSAVAISSPGANACLRIKPCKPSLSLPQDLFSGASAIVTEVTLEDSAKNQNVDLERFQATEVRPLDLLQGRRKTGVRFLSIFLSTQVHREALAASKLVGFACTQVTCPNHTTLALLPKWRSAT
jgi:hypothetical protein